MKIVDWLAAGKSIQQLNFLLVWSALLTGQAIYQGRRPLVGHETMLEDLVAGV